MTLSWSIYTPVTSGCRASSTADELKGFFNCSGYFLYHPCRIRNRYCHRERGRTPMGRYCGKLRDFTAMELGAIVATEAMKRSGVEPGDRSRRDRHCAADFGRFDLRRAACRAQSWSAGGSSGPHRQSLGRLGHAISCDCRADDRARRVDDRAGWRHGVHVASAARRSAACVGASASAKASWKTR